VKSVPRLLGDASDRGVLLLEDLDAVIFVDIAPRGGAPGTVYLIEVQQDTRGEVTLDTHGMDPVKVLSLARAMGANPTRTFVVACEPQRVLSGEGPDLVVELTKPVQAAVEEAVEMVEALVQEIEGRSDMVHTTIGERR